MDGKKIFVAKSVYAGGVERLNFSFIVSCGKILAVGETRTIREQFPLVKEESLDGYVYPSFFDAHTHLKEVALLLSSVHGSAILNYQELVGVIDAQKTEPICIYNLDFNRIDSREWLDLYKRKRRIFIQSKDEHSVFVSKSLIDFHGITVQEVSGGELLHFNGQFVGVFRDNAINFVTRVKDRNLSKEQIEKAQIYFLERGITSIVNFDFSIYPNLEEMKNVSKIRVVQGIQKDYLSQFVRDEVKTNDGDEMLKIGAVKCFLDGSLGSQTAYMVNGMPFKGLLTMEEGEFRELVQLANNKGIQVAVHSIGSGAVHIALSTFKNYSNPYLRNRIEHLQFIDEGDRELLRDTPFIASMQPIHAISDYDIYMKYMDNFRYAYPWKTVEDSSKVIAFGSDAPVDDASPLLGIYAATQRKTLDKGKSYLLEEAISLDDAIKAYTFGSAYASFAESYLGDIKEGYLADFVVLDKALLFDKILKNRVLATYLGGEMVWTR